MNITLAIDEKVAESARKAAQSMGKSLNQAVREYLQQLAGRPALAAELAELRQLAMQGKGSAPDWKFDREEIYADRLGR
jgi:antitoxin component of RelBE/YafQ-DinJ toxin-antitoxin module